MIIKRTKTGQVGLVVLLVMGVLTVLSLGVAEQMVLNTSNTRQESDSEAVFNVAESAVQGDVVPQDSRFDYIRTPSTLSQYSILLEKDEGAQLLLGGASPINFTVKWADRGNCANDSSLMVTLWKSNSVKRFFYGPSGCARNDGATLVTSDGTNFTSPLISPGAVFDLARIQAFYADTVVTVVGASIPSQGLAVTAEGNRESGERRTVEVTLLSPQWPSIFDYVVVDGTDSLTFN